MTTALLTMSEREYERAELLRRVHERRLTQRKAAQLLGMSQRQVERLYRAYKHSGPKSLVSRKRGRPSNRRLSEELRRTALGLIRERYSDFGPTLANEKLREEHQLRVSTETLRRWMIEDGLWLPHARRRDRIHQPRRRRDCLGELIQIDGCDHEWFEERGARCVLLVYVDDATSQLMELRFCEGESTFEYFASTRGYLERHGKPVAFYSDKASVFRVNSRDPAGGDGITQFGRAMSELNIDTICANSAPAKGRVERAHLTLQDRLVKELRLRGISSIAEAGFSKPASNGFNAHRPLLESENLEPGDTPGGRRRGKTYLDYEMRGSCLGRVLGEGQPISTPLPQPALHRVALSRVATRLRSSPLALWCTANSGIGRVFIVVGWV